MKTESVHILNGCADICSPTGSYHGPWNSGVVSLVWPLLHGLPVLDSQTPPFQHCLHLRNLRSDLSYLLIFRCKLRMRCHVNMGLLPMMGNLRCCNNIHWGNKGLCHSSMDVCWPHDIIPSKINLIWTPIVNSRVMIPKQKVEVLPVCIRCTTLLPKQADILLCIMDNNIWFMNLNSPIYSTLLQNKFVNLVVVFVHLRFWSLSRPKRIWLQWYPWGVCSTRRLAMDFCMLL